MDIAFPFLALPPELRVEVYRHLFSIYPDHRCHIIPPPGGGGAPSRNAFGITKHHPISKIDISKTKGSEWAGPEKHKIRVAGARDFLAVLQVNGMIYEEAVRIFYSETFFITDEDMSEMIRFLRRIGAPRRRFIRHIAFAFTLPSIMGGRGRYSSMRALASELMDSEHVETIEIRVMESAVKEGLQRSMVKALHTRWKKRKGTEGLEVYEPVVFSGIQHLCRLKYLGNLVLVCRKIFARWYKRDTDWFGHLEGCEWEEMKRKATVILV